MPSNPIQSTESTHLLCKMKKTFLTILMACYALLASAQLNMTLTDQIDYTPQVSSLWGYIDPEDSTEYAAVGVSTGLSVVDLTDPYNIQEIAFVPDVNSQWREVKSWGHYIYAVTEGGGGMLVVNMTDPDNVTSTHWAPNIPGLGTLNKVHSITVDEFGYLYLNGSNLNAGGPLIVDVSADNGNPVYVGKLPAIYCHDSYARNNILYTSDIYVGNFKVYDITNKSNPVLLATQQTPYNFTHNTWLNDAGTVIFTTDEKANAPVGVYDISDLDNIVELDQFRPVSTIGLGTIPHNVHVWNDWVVTAYYTNGTIIIDGSRPENMIEVGNFDSFVSNPAGFYGVWGVYPYFPSGLVISSDMQNGLLVYDVNYVRACWLEGKVTNAITGANISGASVSIASAQANAGTSDLLGNYKTGQAIPGTFDVTFTATGYFPKTVPAVLQNGVLTILDVALEPMTIANFPPFSYSTPTTGCELLSVNFSENSGIVAAWSWTFEGGFPPTSDEQNPSVQFVAGTHSVSLTVTTHGGNTYNLSSTDLVTAEPMPNANFTNSIDSLSVSFANASTNYTSLVWDFGDGGTSTDANPLHTYAQVGTYMATLTATGPCGTDVFTKNVKIGPFAPQVSFGANVVAGCAPLTVSFTDQSTNGPTVWGWSFPGGIPSSSNQQNPTVTYTTPGSYSVQLTASNAAGSGQSIQSGFITVQEAAVAGFLTTVDGPEVLFTNVSFGNNMSYSWDFGDGQTSTEQNPLHIYAAPGNYNVYLTVNNACGTSAYSEIISIADFLPTAGFTSDIKSGCAPLTVTYTDQSSGPVNSWNWSFPGGSPATSNEQNPVVTYSNSGVFTATLVVENTWGNNTASQNDLITINNTPLASCDFTINENSVSFINNSNNALNYEWVFNDGSGTISTELNPTHIFPGPGTYEVVLNATNGCGAASHTAEVIISMAAPTAAFDLDYTGDCAPLQVQFTDQSEGEPTAWLWSFPGGTPATSTEQNPVVLYNAAGTFDITLTVTNSAGSNEVVLPAAISIDAAPQASFTANVNDLTAVFTTNAANATSYLWDFADGATSTEENPSHTYAENGVYNVTLTTTNACGSATASYEVTIDVPAPSVDFGGLITNGCAPVVVEFTNFSSGLISSWEWSFPGGTPATSTEQNPTVTYETPGTYDIELTATGPGGSSTLISPDLVIVNTAPTVGFGFSVSETTVSFNNTSQNFDTYTWDFGDGNSTSTDSNPVHQYEAPGSYQATLTVSNECGDVELSQAIVIVAGAVGDSRHLGQSIAATPNPFSQSLLVNFEIKLPYERASLVVANVLGETLANIPLHSSTGVISLGDEFVGSGVFFLHLVVDGQAGKVVKVVRL